MVEAVRDTTERFFTDILRENLKEPREQNVAVIAIGGEKGAGASSTSKALKELLSSRGHDVKLISIDEGKFRVFHSAGPEIKSGADRLKDTLNRLGSELLDPGNSGKVLLVDGRFAPFVAKGLELASRNQPNKLPFKSIGIFLRADEDTRYARGFLAKRNKGLMQSYEREHREMEQEEKDENTNFWEAYPGLSDAHPTNFEFSIGNERVYDLEWSTDRYSGEVDKLAGKIADHDSITSLIAMTQNQS